MKLRPLTIALPALLGSVMAQAQVDPFAALAEDRRPRETRWQTDYNGVLELGAAYTSDDNFMFGQYNDLSDDGLSPIANIDWGWNNNLGDWHLSGSDLGTEVGEVRLEWRGQGFSAYIELESSLQVRNNTGQTPFSGGSNLVLPADWVSARTTGDFETLETSLRNLDQEIERDRYSIGVSGDLGEYWNLDFTLAYEEKEGTRDIGAAIFVDASAGEAAILPGNIDHDALELDLALNYQGERLKLSGSWFYSDFDNGDDLLTWQNPYRSSGSAVRYPQGIGGLGTAPDHEYNQLRLRGTYRLTPTLRLQVDGSYAKTEQDQRYANYTANPQLSIDEPLPRSNLDGELETLTLDTRLIFRLFRKLNLEAWFHGEERDYDVPRDGYRAVPGDGGDQSRSSLTVYNTGHDYTVNRYGIEGSYRLPWRSKLWLAYEYEEVERKNAAVEDTEEDRYTLKYRLPLGSGLTSRWELRYEDRVAQVYNWDQSYYARLDPQLINATPDAQRYNTHPLLSQHHLASRERTEARLDINWQIGMHWNISLNLLLREDDYEETVLGLQEEEATRIGLTAAWLPHSNLTLSAYGSVDAYNRDQAGRAFRGGIEKNAFEIHVPLPQASDPSRDWLVESEDDVVTVGFNAEWALREDMELSLDYSYVQTEAEYDFANGGARDLGSEPLPVDAETEQHHLIIEGVYHLRENLSVKVNYQYWRYEGDDWAINNIAADSIDKVLTLGEEEPDEDLHYIGTSIIYRW